MAAINIVNIGGSSASGSSVSSIVTGSVAWGSSTELITGHLIYNATTTDNRVVSSVAGPSITADDAGAGLVSQAMGGGFTLYHQVFRFKGTGATEAITVTFSGTVNRARIHWCRASGDMDLGGSNGANAIVQHPFDNTHTSATPSLTMAALADATNNAELVSFAKVGVGTTSTPKSGFTELHDFDQASEIALYTEWRLGQDTSPNYSAPTSDVYVGIGLEISAGAAAGQPTVRRASMVNRPGVSFNSVRMERTGTIFALGAPAGMVRRDSGLYVRKAA